MFICIQFGPISTQTRKEDFTLLIASLIFLKFIYILIIKESDEARLHQYLFNRDENSGNKWAYNPNLRPVRNSKTQVMVDARLGIKRIFEMDEANHRVTLFAALFKVTKFFKVNVLIDKNF